MLRSTYIDPADAIKGKTKKQIQSLYNEVQDFMYREEIHGGSVKKLEKVYSDFEVWKTKSNFDKRSHMEDISQALSDKM